VVAPRCPRPARRLPESEPGAGSWRRPSWASGGVELDLVVIVGGGWAAARLDTWPTRRSRSCARIARRGSRSARRGSPTCYRLRAGRQGQDRRARGRPCPGRWVACSGRALGLDGAEGVRPHRGPGRQWVRLVWGRQRSELGEQWWACQDLNLGPHPYQVSPAERRAIQHDPRPCSSVIAAGMG
jgi:hypothetical protein